MQAGRCAGVAEVGRCGHWSGRSRSWKPSGARRGLYLGPVHVRQYRLQLAAVHHRRDRRGIPMIMLRTSYRPVSARIDFDSVSRSIGHEADRRRAGRVKRQHQRRQRPRRQVRDGGRHQRVLPACREAAVGVDILAIAVADDAGARRSTATLLAVPGGLARPCRSMRVVCPSRRRWPACRRRT